MSGEIAVIKIVGYDKFKKKKQTHIQTQTHVSLKAAMLKFVLTFIYLILQELNILFLHDFLTFY